MWRRSKKPLIIALAAIWLLTSCSGLGAQDTPVITPDSGQEISKVVSATGIVTPAKKSTLSVSTAGIIAEVLVEKGDTVRANQVLVRLKGKEEIQASIAAANAELLSAQQALDDLYDKVALARAQSLRDIYEASNAVRDAKYRLDNYTIPDNQKDMDAITAMEAMKQKLDAAWAAFEPYKNSSYLNDQRKALKEDVDNAQSDYNTAVKRLTYEFELAEAKAQLDQALKDNENLKSGPDPDKVTLANARLENAKTSLAAAESMLDDLEINALFDGTVSDLYIREGEWVSPGQPIVLLAELQHLRVETTDLNEIDVAQVKVGDKAKVTFDALPGVEVDGTVNSIAPKSSEGSGVNYTVVVELSSIPENLKWGMTAFVDITIGS
jgi:multidrug efflux pump subunit AcrA (membrane-fusion protein)